jgi:hypothetical protein
MRDRKKLPRNEETLATIGLFLFPFTGLFCLMAVDMLSLGTNSPRRGMTVAETDGVLAKIAKKKLSAISTSTSAPFEVLI